MATEPREETPQIVRHDRAQTSDDRSSGVICDGCRELAERVTRLEQALAARQETTAPQAPSTTFCYWICVGVHAFCALLMYSSHGLIQFGMMLSIGATATLVVSQTLATRPLMMRFARSLLAVTVVSGAALLGMWLGNVAGPSDTFPYLWMFFPPVLASGWFVAKAFVWTLGWRIIPPDCPPTYPRLRIQHLMLCTFLIAAYLAVGRWMVDELQSWIGDDFVLMYLYLCVPMVVCTVISCLLARIILPGRGSRAILQCLALVAGATACIAGICLGLVALSGETDFDSAVLLTLMIYVLPLTLGLFASSGGTFMMMRAASYRFGPGATAQV